MERTEKEQNKRTILFSIIGGVVLTASIIFFVIGLIALNAAKKTKTTYIYVSEPWDPKGEEAQENAKVDLVVAQMKFEEKSQVVQRRNFYLDIDEDSYIGPDVFGYEVQYVNQYGEQRYAETLYAENDNYVKRFVNGNFVGYTYNVEGKAREYLHSKQHPLVLDAYNLEFVSNSGANSVFSTASDEMNELWAAYTRTEYDGTNNKLFFVNIYADLGYVMVTLDSENPAQEDFLLFQPVDNYDYDEMPKSLEVNDFSTTTINAYNFANVQYYMLPGSGDYVRYYIQPKSGAYGSNGSFSPSEEDKEHFTIGFINTGKKFAEYGDTYLVPNGWTYDGAETAEDDDEVEIARNYSRTETRYISAEETITFKYKIRLSFDSAEDRPAFEKGVMLVEHSREVVE